MTTMLLFYNNAAASDMYNTCDCLGVAILSHGDDGVICGTDEPISIENLVAPIRNCPELKGKPKFFIYQVNL